ncbi:uncharacterized protein LOC129255804 [Lytechinus pictus]|uniref:uncharacterized protein LOC129255804 n=1 Tax=Lytechinus pictus TaxID=7653 RepID=UPI0030B9CCE9
MRALQKSFLDLGSEGSQPWMLPQVEDDSESIEIPDHYSTACKCRTGNQKCWTKCARIYQSKRRAESPRSEQILPDILKQSSEIDDIIYEDILDNNQRNSADSPNLEELLDSLPFPWRRNIYRLIQKAEMAELENFL